MVEAVAEERDAREERGREDLDGPRQRLISVRSDFSGSRHGK